jgi:AcrR family transcriptional regulator
MEERLRADWYDQITLEGVADSAGVTVATVLRRFGSKDGLLEATWRRMGEGFLLRRAVLPGDARGAVRAVVREYEAYGDLVVRALAQEERFPVFKPASDVGRRGHREWVEGSFAPNLEGLSPAQRRHRIDGLVTALDLYVWQLIRRDMGRSAAHVERVMLDLVAGVLGDLSIGNNAGMKGNEHE